MKNIKKLSLILVLLVVSCSDNFIELAPISEGNAENFFNTPADFEAAIIGAYSNLSNKAQYGSDDTRYGGSFYALMEVRADDVSDGEASSGAGRAVFEIDTYDDNPLSSIIEDAWTSIFKTIFDANSVISRIDNIEIDTSLKNQYLGEARFLRGLAYFNAVRLWGDVPVILKEITPQEAKALSRDNVTEVYDAIVADFTFASQNLPATFSGQEGRATSGAAKALLGKVYLTQQDWTNASSILQEVIGSYELLPNVEDVYALDNELNDEIIFSVRFRGGSDDLGHLGFGTPAYSALSALYDINDKRLPLLAPIGTGPDSTYPMKQFEASDSEQGRDFPVLRYADVLLMLSEALNEVGYQVNGNAFTYLNEIRTRAGIPNYTGSELTNQAEFRDAILKERRLELPLELHRWFDLLRTNSAVQALNNVGVNVQQHQLLFPIPQNEINVFNNSAQFPQNPGY